MASELKTGYMFNRGVRRQTIVNLMMGLVRPEALNAIEPERVVMVWDNALLAKRREALLKAGRFVSREEAARGQGGGGRRGRGRSGHHQVPGAGPDVNARGASGLSEYRRGNPQKVISRCRVFVPHDDITTKTWAGVITLVRRHDIARDLDELDRLTPGDPVPLRDAVLPALLVQALVTHGSFEYRVA